MGPAEIEARVGEWVGLRAPWLAGARAVLAVSGGADSTATTALLFESGVLEPARCLLAHFDHALRGENAAERDADAVRALADRYGAPSALGRWQTPRPGEAAGREARYAFLATHAAEHGAAAVVTGHTRDDQAETVAMHALRGAGLRGLAGIGAVTTPASLGGIRLVRPLLDVSRAETRGYCAARGLAFFDDETNADPAFLRNRVRARLQAAPAAAEALVRLAGSARDALSRVEAVAVRPLVDAGEYDGGPPQVVRISRPALRGLPDGIAPHTFRLALGRLVGDAREFDRRHYAALAAAALGRTGAELRLPRGVVLSVDATELLLTLGPPRVPAIGGDEEHGLPFEGRLGGWTVSIIPVPTPAGPSSEGVIRLPEGAVLRGRRPGDRLRLPGGRRRKLQDELVDRKLPRRERDALPLVADGGEVLWAPGLRVGAATAGRWYAARARSAP